MEIIVQIRTAEMDLKSRISFLVGDDNKYQLRRNENATMNLSAGGRKRVVSCNNLLSINRVIVLPIVRGSTL